MEVYIVNFITGDFECECGGVFKYTDKIFSSKEDAEQYIVNQNNQLIEDKLHTSNYHSDAKYVNDAKYMISVKEKYGHNINFSGGCFEIEGPYKIES